MPKKKEEIVATKIKVFEGPIAKLEKSKNRNIKADRYLKEIIFTKQSIGLSFLYLGNLLYNIKEEKLWELHAESYAEYIAMPEINMKLSTGDNLIRVYRQFVVEWGMDEELLCKVGHSKLIALLERTDIDAESADEWIHKAMTLSWRDIQIESGASPEEFSGIIAADIYQDDKGLLIEIKNAPKNISTGLYRLEKDGAKGTVVQLGYLKGRKTNG